MIYKRREGPVITWFVMLKNFYASKAKLRELSTFVNEQCTPSVLLGKTFAATQQ